MTHACIFVSESQLAESFVRTETFMDISKSDCVLSLTCEIVDYFENNVVSLNYKFKTKIMLKIAVKPVFDGREKNL